MFKLSLILLTCCTINLAISHSVTGQHSSDPADIILNLKPSYQENYPKWGQMLYGDDVGYDQVVDSYKTWKLLNPESHSPIERYYKLWERTVRPFVNASGKIESRAVEAFYTNLNNHQFSSLSARTGAAEGTWEFLGPKETFWLNESGSSQTPAPCPWQVNVYAFDIAQSDPTTLYAGTETGFLSRTDDNGETWEILGQDYNFGGGVTAVAVDPYDSEVAYASAGGQMHKTIDGGLIWDPLLQTQTFGSDRILIDEQAPNRLVSAGGSGIHVSNDKGETWSQSTSTRTYDVETSPDDSDVIYGLSSNSGNFQLLTSVDGGKSFEPAPNFPIVLDAAGGLIAVSDASPQHLWAILLSEDNTPLLYRGDMGSDTWNLLASGNTAAFPMDNWQGFFDLVLEVSTVDPDIIFTGTGSLYKSVNGGGQFTLVGGYGGDFPIHPDVQCMKLLDNGHAWVSTDGGFTHSTDNFVSVQNAQAKNNFLIGSDMWGFDQGWNEDIIVGGRYHNGNTAISDLYQPKALRMGGAESPTGWVMQGKSRHVAFNDLGPGWVLPETAESQPQGRFIFSKYPNMDEYGGRRGNLVFHPNYYEVVYLGEGNAFWKSSDMGVTFEMLHDFGNRVRYLQNGYSDPNVIYADVVNRGLFKSEDGGYTWVAKPSLTSGSYGTTYWQGKLHIAVSPTNANTLYTCLQNGTWSADIGKIFKSTDGGDTWENWTGSLDVFCKTLVVQPDSLGRDLTYLFTTNKNGKPGQCFIRRHGESDWTVYGDSYPASFAPNHALPFYRDSKIRVAGNGGIWENMLDQKPMPIITPWVERPLTDCVLDTVQFDDHSILNHADASWTWKIDPEPSFISDINSRSPQVVLGSTESYDVTLTVTIDGNTYSKTVTDMIRAQECPSLENCDNPAILPKSNWSLLYVDSEEINYPGTAVMAFDDDPETIWHTRWSTGSDPYPHEIQIDLGEVFDVHEFTYLPRQNGQNGWIDEYELYISEDSNDWGSADTISRFEKSAAPHVVKLSTPSTGRYVRLVALSEANGNAWASAAEFSVKGCYHETAAVGHTSKIESLNAFPVPTSGLFEVTLPNTGMFTYTLMNSSGQVITKGQTLSNSSVLSIDLSDRSPGVYLVRLRSNSGTTFLVKVIRS